MREYNGIFAYGMVKHTLKVTFQIGEHKGYGLLDLNGNIYGLDTFSVIENAYPDEYREFIGVSFKDSIDPDYIVVQFADDEDSWEIPLEDVNKMIVGIEIVDCAKYGEKDESRKKATV